MNKLGLSASEAITWETRFYEDLGIYGDDGDFLLQDIADEYNLNFSEESFSLQPNETLFVSEHFWQDIDLLYFMGFRKQPKRIIRSFRVGELYEAVCHELQKRV